MDKYNHRIASPMGKGPPNFHPLEAARDDAAKSGPLYLNCHASGFEVNLETSARHVRVSLSRRGDVHDLARWSVNQWSNPRDECWVARSARSNADLQGSMVSFVMGQKFIEWAQVVLDTHKVDLRQLAFMGAMLAQETRHD